MAQNTVLLGVLLIILGVGTYALMGFVPEMWTSLLPAAVGVGFVVLGGMAQRRASWRARLLHAAFVLAVLVALGTAPGLLDTLALLAGNPVERPTAAIEQGFTALVCLGFLGRALSAYVSARREGVDET